MFERKITLKASIRANIHSVVSTQASQDAGWQTTVNFGAADKADLKESRTETGL